MRTASRPTAPRALLLALASASLVAYAAPPETQPADQRLRRAFAPVVDEPGLPRVLLIGDSISIGYTPVVREKLKGIANVHRIPENGGPTTKGLEKIDEWLGKGRWDVIHFNWGLHDLKRLQPDRCQVPLEQYEANLKRLVARLERTGAVLVWATTTPVPEGAQQRDPADVPRYAEAALRVMRDNHIAVDDLFAFAQPRLADIQLPKNVHYTPDGSAELAKPVVASILKALKRESATSTAPAADAPAPRRSGMRRGASTRPASERRAQGARSAR